MKNIKIEKKIKEYIGKIDEKYRDKVEQHIRYKFYRELKDLEQVEEDIKSNMDTLKEEIREEIRELDDKLEEWDFIEANKYNRLEKTEKRIREKIRESKNKELKIIIAFLTYNAFKTDEEMREVYNINIRKIEEKTINEILKNPWSGLTVYDRHQRATNNLDFKVKEKLNSSLNAEDRAKDAIGDIEAELDKSARASFILTDSENTHIDYEVTTRALGDDAELVYNAILDSATCGACSSQDGKRYKKGGEPILPQHTNCRCFYTSL